MTCTARGQEWKAFSTQVLNHVENYTVPQYGDKPDDLIEQWTVEDCLKDIKKRIERFGKNKRPNQEALDLIKIAHVACVAHSKLNKKGFFKKLGLDRIFGRFQNN
jgi:hypothetical protein